MHARPSGHARSPHAIVLHTKGRRRRPAALCGAPGGFACCDPHPCPPGTSEAGWSLREPAAPAPPQRRERPPLTFPPPLPSGRPSAARLAARLEADPSRSERLSAVVFQSSFLVEMAASPAPRKRLGKPARPGLPRGGPGPSAARPPRAGAFGARTSVPGTALLGVILKAKLSFTWKARR